MLVFIDKDYKCYAQSGSERTSVDVKELNGKCKTYIEGCRYVPEGASWTRADGRVFAGPMLAPLQDSRLLEAVQAEADRNAAAIDALLLVIGGEGA